MKKKTENPYVNYVNNGTDEQMVGSLQLLLSLLFVFNFIQIKGNMGLPTFRPQNCCYVDIHHSYSRIFTFSFLLETSLDAESNTRSMWFK